MKTYSSLYYVAALLLALLPETEGFGKRYTPKYPYNDWQIYHLNGTEVHLVRDEKKHFVDPVTSNPYHYDEGTITFDENGNILTYNYKGRVRDYKYSKKGYKVNDYTNWKVWCDTSRRIRVDYTIARREIGDCFIYVFDKKGRNTALVYREWNLRVLILYHYPDEAPFRPDKSWKAIDYGRVQGDKSSICYSRLDENGNWQEEKHDDGTYTGYYTVHYVVNGEGQGEGLVVNDILSGLWKYRREHSWERGNLARTCKEGETEFEKRVAELGLFDSEGLLLSLPSDGDKLDKNADKRLFSQPEEVKSGSGTKEKVDRLADQHFLFKYISISVKAQTIICNILCVILCLVALFYVGSFTEQITYSDMSEVIVGKVFLLLISLCELAVFYLCPDADGFMFKLNGIWMLIPLAALLVLFVGQVSSTVQLLELGSEYSGRDAPYELTYFGFVVYLIALIISMFAENLRSYALIIGFSVLGIQIIIDLIATLLNRAGFLQFLLHALWLVVCGSTIMLLSYAFAGVAAIALVCCAFVMGPTKAKTPCCANCRTYSNGYCSYRKEYKSGSDNCSRHQW